MSEGFTMAEAFVDVKVDDKTDPGVAAKLAKVRAQLDQVAIAEKRVQDAQGKAAVSQAKLTDLRKAGGASDGKMAAAEEALAKAHRDVEVAQLRLSGAQSKATVIQNQSTASAKKARDTSIGLWSTLGLFAPAIIPIAEAALVAGGALAGMGLAGVAAFKGASKEMAAGTAEGKLYSAGVKTVTNDLGRLEAIAAKNTLAGFQSSVSVLHRNMPLLNKDMAIFGADLGDVAHHTISGVLGEWRQFNPLLLQAAAGTTTIAGDFDRWANGPGGAKFAQSVGAGFERALPFLKDSATAIGHIFEAAGNSGALEVLDGAVRLFDAIPVDVLKVAVPLATGLGFAIKGMKVAEQAGVWIGGLTGKLGGLAVAEGAAAKGATGFAGALGPAAGILIGGYAVTQQFGDQLDRIANSFATGKIMASQNESGLDDLKNAYFQFNGVASTSTDSLLQFALSGHSGVLGIGALGDKVADLVPHLAALGVTTADVSQGVSGNDDQFQKLIGTVKAHGGATEDDIRVLNDLHTAFAGTTSDADVAAGSVTNLTKQQKKLADETLAAAGQLGFLSPALAGVSGNAVDAEQQELKFKDALAGATQQVKDNGSAINDNTVKGRSNKEWLLTQIQAINSHAEAVGKQTGSVGKATAALASDEAQLRASARAAGLNTVQVDALIRKYAATPATVRTQILAETKQALGAVSYLQANIQALKDHKITITTYLQNVILPGLKTDSSTRDSHHAAGGGVSDGWFTVGEGNPNTWELGHKQGSDLQFYSNAQSKKMRPAGPYGPMPGYAGGTVGGIKYSSDLSYQNALVRAGQSSAAKRDSLLKQERVLILKIDAGDTRAVLSRLFGSVTSLQSATRTMLTDAQRAVNLGMGPQSLINTLTRDNNRLITLAGKRATVATRLAAANTALAAATKLYRDEGTAVSSGITGTFDITSAGAGSGVGSTDRLIASLQMDVGDAQGFATELAHLKALGLNTALYKQLAEGGSGSANAQALQGATAAQVKQINALYGTLAKTANATGTTVATSLYGAGVNAAKGLVAGLASQEKNLEKQMRHLADVMVSEITHKLKIHSPSQVGHDIGANFGRGVDLGVQSQHGKIAASSARYGDAMTAFTGQPGAGLPGPGMHVGEVHVHMHADDIAGMKSAVEFFTNLERTVRAGVNA